DNLCDRVARSCSQRSRLEFVDRFEPKARELGRHERVERRSRRPKPKLRTVKRHVSFGCLVSSSATDQVLSKPALGAIWRRGASMFGARSFVIALVGAAASGCAGSTPSPAEPEQPPPASWSKDMTMEQKEAFMKAKVVPAMHGIFQNANAT